MTILNHDEIADKIRSSALLVSLQLGSYNPTKTDKSASRKVSADHGISNDKLMKVQKNTLPTAKVIEDIDRLDTRIRAEVDRFTAPFARGIGLLPATKFFDLRNTVNLLFDERDRLIKKLADEYTLYLEGAKAELNGAFRSEDYPPVGDVVAKFRHKLDAFAIANPKDAKLNVLGEIADSIQQAASDTLREKFETVTPHLRSVLLDPLRAMLETLQNPDAIYRDSLFTNVIEAAERAEALNLLDDADVAAAITAIRDYLAIDPGSCREDKRMRAQTVNDCVTIVTGLGGTVPPPKITKAKAPRKGKSAPKAEAESAPEIAPEPAPEPDDDGEPEILPETPARINEVESQPESDTEALLNKLGW